MIPSWLPRKYERHWNEPWKPRARLSPGFRRQLQDHGYLTPNFTLAEAACHDGTPVPHSLVRRARDHAFNLERLRHRLGDVPMPVLSWYRTPAYNHAIGGASQSRHMQADASDFTREWANSIGHSKLLAEAEIVFKNGGIGNYPSGSVHFDSRGWRARWITW